MRIYGFGIKAMLCRLALVGLATCVSAAAVSANNVQVQLEGSLLKVFGDNAGNRVVINQNAAGDVIITGQNGTKVNQLGRVVLRRVSLNAVEVRMEGGNDIVTFQTLRVANDLYVNLGSGNDRVQSTQPVTVGNNFSIEGDQGDDTVTLLATSVTEDLNIDGGVGVLRATLTNVDGGKGLTIIGDDAQDLITVRGTSAADYISIEAKKGNNRINVDSSIALGLLIGTDLGSDTVAVTDFMAMADFGVFTGAGADNVSLSGVTCDKSLTVSVDAGNDTVVGTDVRVAEDAVFEGGAGFDVLEDAGITGGIKKDIKEFEVVL